MSASSVRVIYPKYKETILGAATNTSLISGSTIKVSLVDTTTTAYTYDPSHQFYSSIASYVVASATLTGTKTVTGGVFKSTATSTTFSAVSGNSAEAIVIWIDTGLATSSPLVAYLDTGVSGLPVTPNSGDIIINWDTVNGIFAL